MQQLMVRGLGPQIFKLPLLDDVDDVYIFKLLFEHAHRAPDGPTARGLVGLRGPIGPWPRCAQLEAFKSESTVKL